MAALQTRAELKSYQSQTNASTTQERSKLLVSMTQEFVRHLNDCVRGEYRDRLIVVNPRLRLYTRALGVFSEMQSRTNQSAPPFRDPRCV
jgi:interferon-induced GTP-binding protein Mx1